MAYAYKYTDRDVREDGRLAWLVTRYLHEYTGEFEFLLSARLRLANDGELPVGIIRGVLNCMRTDPRWSESLPAPTPTPREVAPVYFPRIRSIDVGRPARIELKATFNRPYIMSQYKSAYLAHRLNHGESHMWWFPHTSSFECRFRTWCDVSYSHRANIIMVATVPGDRFECRRCLIALEAYNDSSHRGSA